MTIPAELITKLENQGIAPGSYRFTPATRVRKTIARRLTEAARDIPHFQLSLEVRAAALIAFRATLNAQFAADQRISVNDLILAASGTALVAHPDVNSSYTEDGIVAHDAVDVSFAVAIPGGLVTPIVRDAARLPLNEFGPRTRELAERGGRMRLRPEEYIGGSFCISNLGMYGIRDFTSIINPPHGAILSVGTIEDRVVPVDGQPRIAPMMTLTLNCDHRVVDGATGAKFLAHLRSLLECPNEFATGRG